MRATDVPFETALEMARAELQTQRARLGTAVASLQRVEPLAAEDAPSQKDLDDALAAVRPAGRGHTAVATCADAGPRGAGAK